MVLPAVSKKGKSMGNLKEYSKEIKETAANFRIIDDALWIVNTFSDKFF